MKRALTTGVDRAGRVVPDGAVAPSNLTSYFAASRSVVAASAASAAGLRGRAYAEDALGAAAAHRAYRVWVEGLGALVRA